MKSHWRKSFSMILVAVGLATSSPRSSEAISLVFDPLAQTVAQGGTVGVDVKLTDLGSTLVGAYNVTVGFDPGVLAYSNVAYGTGLGYSADSVTFDDASISGLVSVNETSFLSTAGLASLQTGNDLLLFTLFFTGSAEGQSPLSFVAFDSNGDSVLWLSDDLGDQIQADPGSGSVTVTANVVPEPGTLLLLGSGLACLAYRRRRSHPREGRPDSIGRART